MPSARGKSNPKFFPTSRRFKTGDLIAGKYRLERQVGAGAMGAVWVARNELLDVDVAVKLLRPIDSERSNPSKMYQRLLQEARAAARLGHPAIVRVFDFGQAEDNTPFIVMELLAGESLAGRMTRQRRFGMVESVQLMLPVADALATAHGRGIVHRDVKPENIFLARDEYGRLQPKLVDFGVARFAEGGRSLTRSGALMGTPDYMAPEQARGEPDIDYQVDIWALCIVLYELIAGERPFATDSANYLAVLRAIVQDPVPSLLDKGYGDPALWLIIERGLRKDRRERWDTMRVLGEALALWLYERGVKEDALGASLKTTWLQSGLDGIKIETGSVFPPPGPHSTLSAPPGPVRRFTPPQLPAVRQSGRVAEPSAPLPPVRTPSFPPPSAAPRPLAALDFPALAPTAQEATDSALSLSLGEPRPARSARPVRWSRPVLWLTASLLAGPLVSYALVSLPGLLRDSSTPVDLESPSGRMPSAPSPPVLAKESPPRLAPNAPASASDAPASAHVAAAPAASTERRAEPERDPVPLSSAPAPGSTVPPQGARASRVNRPRPARSAPGRKPLPSANNYDFGF